jgi:hypothetical protein
MNDTVHVVVVDDDDDDRALENLVHVAAFFYCLCGELGSQEILRYKKLCVWGVLARGVGGGIEWKKCRAQQDLLYQFKMWRLKSARWQ